ncbi:hypothetical protein JT25_015270 [Methylomonas denitrificans]|uniref:Uncharacterized protein n=1 Tax=Methylomonas denitrificans TaxID=1538553 RepID=A0A126T6W6_9GAMM|nr:hypothetical protein JT25_015270 [Methylomonas denitrificans]
MPAKLLGLIARLGRLARKVKKVAIIAKYLVHELKRVAHKFKVSSLYAIEVSKGNVLQLPMRIW